MLDVSFPYEKVIQALNYLVRKEKNEINKMKLIKLIYFADRYHLRKYGELLTQDKYFGMKLGPIPSITKDVLSFNDFLDENILNYAEEFIEQKGKYDIISKKEVDKDYLSETEVEALEFAYKIFGDKDQYKLSEITHDYPEWINIKDKLDNSKRVEIDIKNFVNDPINKQDPCYELEKTEKEELLEEIEEKLASPISY